VYKGADISLEKIKKFLVTAEFEPEGRVRLKSVEVSMIETHGCSETQILEGGMSIPYRLQLVSK